MNRNYFDPPSLEELLAHALRDIRHGGVLFTEDEYREAKSLLNAERARTENEVKAEALREAADALAELGNDGFPAPWLRTRADNLHPRKDQT